MALRHRRGGGKARAFLTGCMPSVLGRVRVSVLFGEGRCVGGTFLPGYLPSVLEGVKSKRLAPVSVAMAWASMRLPEPLVPTNSTGIPFLSMRLGWVGEVWASRSCRCAWGG